MNPLKPHGDAFSLNNRAVKDRLDEHYNDKKRIKQREVQRIRLAKKYRENDIENLKTKKKHL